MSAKPLTTGGRLASVPLAALVAALVLAAPARARGDVGLDDPDFSRVSIRIVIVDEKIAPGKMKPPTLVYDRDRIWELLDYLRSCTYSPPAQDFYDLSRVYQPFSRPLKSPSKPTPRKLEQLAEEVDTDLGRYKKRNVDPPPLPVPAPGPLAGPGAGKALDRADEDKHPPAPSDPSPGPRPDPDKGKALEPEAILLLLSLTTNVVLLYFVWRDRRAPDGGTGASGDMSQVGAVDPPTRPPALRGDEGHGWKPDPSLAGMDAEGLHFLTKQVLAGCGDDLPNGRFVRSIYVGGEIYQVECSAREIRERRDELNNGLKRIEYLRKRISDDQLTLSKGGDPSLKSTMNIEIKELEEEKGKAADDLRKMLSLAIRISAVEPKLSSVS